MEAPEHRSVGCQEVGTVTFTFDRRLAYPGGQILRAIWATLRLPEDPRWVAAYRLEPQDGRFVIAEMRVVPYDTNARPGPPQAGPTPAGGVPATLLRVIHTEAVLKRVQADWQELLNEKDAEGFFTRIFREFDIDAKVVEARTRRATPSDDELAALSRDYVVLCGNGTRAPRRALAENRSLSAGHIAKQLHEARNRGLLAGRGPGRPGGTLTDYAERLLEESRSLAA